MSLEELEIKATDLREKRNKITEELREIVKLIDEARATQSVKDIVSGLSDEQKKAMYAQLVGVSVAGSGATGKSGSKSNG